MDEKRNHNCLVQIAICVLFTLNSEARPESKKIHSDKEQINLDLIALIIGAALLLLNEMHIIKMDHLTVKFIEVIVPLFELLGWLLRFL